MTVRLFKVSPIEFEQVGSPKCAAAAAIFVVINVVARVITLRPYASRGGYLFSSGSIFASS